MSASGEENNGDLLRHEKWSVFITSLLPIQFAFLTLPLFLVEQISSFHNKEQWIDRDFECIIALSFVVLTFSIILSLRFLVCSPVYVSMMKGKDCRYKMRTYKANEQNKQKFESICDSSFRLSVGLSCIGITLLLVDMTWVAARRMGAPMPQPAAAYQPSGRVVAEQWCAACHRGPWPDPIVRFEDPPPPDLVVLVRSAALSPADIVALVRSEHDLMTTEGLTNAEVESSARYLASWRQISCDPNAVCRVGAKAAGARD